MCAHTIAVTESDGGHQVFIQYYRSKTTKGAINNVDLQFPWIFRPQGGKREQNRHNGGQGAKNSNKRRKETDAVS